MKTLKAKCLEAAKTHPELISEIEDIYQMAHEEIMDGGSETNEVELAISALEEILK